MLPIHPELKGRTAAITGGSGVLCRAMAIELARQGVTIAILNRNEENGRKVVAEIERAGGKAAAFPCDVCDAGSVKQAEAEVSRHFGPCDILINGAGGNHPEAITSQEILKPADLLGTLLWLVSENASGFVTGITVPVDGGFMAYSGV